MKFADRTKLIDTTFMKIVFDSISDPDLISFAGGLPNPKSFPVDEFNQCFKNIMANKPEPIFQYGSTKGSPELRELIAKRYADKGKLNITADDILITAGSQQAFDLLGKTFLNKNDKVLIEKPSYFGGVQAFSLFEPEFFDIELKEDGIDIEATEECLKNNPDIKLIYLIPNFQNPTGLTLSAENRKKLAELIKKYDCYLIEDNPYEELRFSGEDLDYIKKDLKDQSIVLGSFSKILSPGIRLGWIVCTDKEVMNTIEDMKQSTDLHTSNLSQALVCEYLKNYDLDKHIAMINKLYKEHATCMLDAIKKYFPENVEYTKPDGGMFIWATLPEGIKSSDLFFECVKQNVAFVPGDPSYVNPKDIRTMRLNYTNSDKETIEKGIKILADIIKKQLA